MKQEKKNGTPHACIEGFGDKIMLKIALPRNCIVIDGEIYLYLDTAIKDYDKICGSCALCEKCERGEHSYRDAMMPCELFGDGEDYKHFVKYNPEEL